MSPNRSNNDNRWCCNSAAHPSESCAAMCCAAKDTRYIDLECCPRDATTERESRMEESWVVLHVSSSRSGTVIDIEKFDMRLALQDKTCMHLAYKNDKVEKLANRRRPWVMSERCDQCEGVQDGRELGGFTCFVFEVELWLKSRSSICGWYYGKACAYISQTKPILEWCGWKTRKSTKSMIQL